MSAHLESGQDSVERLVYSREKEDQAQHHHLRGRKKREHSKEEEGKMGAHRIREAKEREPSVPGKTEDSVKCSRARD